MMKKGPYPGPFFMVFVWSKPEPVSEGESAGERQAGDAVKKGFMGRFDRDFPNGASYAWG